MAGSKGIPQRQAYVPDAATARVDQARADLAQVLSHCPFLRGKLVKDVQVIAGSTLVTHGLGYKMHGYFPTTSVSSGGEYPLYLGPGPDPNNQVLMGPGANAFEGDVWFFALWFVLHVLPLTIWDTFT
jgi:hypothetical protein